MAMAADLEKLNMQLEVNAVGKLDAKSGKNDEVDVDEEGAVVEEVATDELLTNFTQIEHEFKHPLEHIWTLWYLENDRSKSWKDMQTEITSLDTVEDFWSLYYTIKTPSELKVGSDYSMFKRGIKPMWEDDANKEGGRWLIAVTKASKVILDKLWLDILLMMIGETFEHPSDVCGAVINIRAKSNKIALWTANGQNQLAILEIGYKLKSILQLHQQNLQYQLHSDAMAKASSGVKSIYTL